MDVFDIWNEQKRILHQKDLPEFYVNEREIWYVKMGKNVGFEQNGKKDFKRPVLVLKKVGNLFFVMALTTQGRDNHFYYCFQGFRFFSQHKLRGRKSYAVLSQVKSMDKRRFIEKMGIVPEGEFRHIKRKLRALFL